MTRKFTDGRPQRLSVCKFLSQYYFYNISLQKSCRCSLQTREKFEALKTGSGVGLLRLAAVRMHLSRSKESNLQKWRRSQVKPR